ncbi:MAG: MopE-related protein [Myxococcota bacterium]|nr:MopE-related protein [Myxococcota bacterium]
MAAVFAAIASPAQACRNAPKVLIVLDRSTSMLYGIDSDGSGLPNLRDREGRRSTVAGEAVYDIVSRYDDRVKFGLAMFPSSRAACGPIREPLVGALVDGQLSVELGAGPDFRRQLDRHNHPTGDSPLGSSLALYSSWLNRPGDVRRMIFVTDGNDSCGGQADLLEQARVASAQGILIYVIGLAADRASQARLDQLAEAGGTGRAFSAQSSDNLMNALEGALEPLFLETCDGVDNDCDGTIDEGYDIDGQCHTGRLGLCSEGVWSCDESEGRSCVSGVNPEPEVCDGFDNDCDGSVDEDVRANNPGCRTGRYGQCDAGDRLCLNGRWACLPNRSPDIELCDGLDNDCDGTIDEGSQGSGESCVSESNCTGEMACTGGRLICLARASVPEQCDGADNDCDGRIDEGFRVHDGTCVGSPEDDCTEFDEHCDGHGADGDIEESREPTASSCDIPCHQNECPVGLVCIKQSCVPACLIEGCSEGTVCTSSGCQIACRQESCRSGMHCESDGCVISSCGGSACGHGEACVANQCVPDSCLGVDCESNQFCRSGVCINSCAGVVCGGDSICIDGTCVARSSVNAECDGSDGCENRPCDLASDCQACGEGEVWVATRCISDPCLSVACPMGQSCYLSDGLAQCGCRTQALGQGGASSIESLPWASQGSTRPIVSEHTVGRDAMVEAKQPRHLAPAAGCSSNGSERRLDLVGLVQLVAFLLLWRLRKRCL